MLKIKNETLLNPAFSRAMQTVCAMVWGRKTDEAVFKVLDSVTAKQNDLNRLYKKYFAEAKISPEKPSADSVAAFNKLWEPVSTDISEIKDTRITLTLKGEAGISGMDRYLLKEIFDFKHEP